MLSKIMNGFREPSAQMREKIALLLKSDEQWLFERIEPAADPNGNAKTDRKAAP